MKYFLSLLNLFLLPQDLPQTQFLPDFNNAYGQTGITSGTTYYISPLGNDLNSGTSSTQAWQTLSAINSFTFRSGDRILFQGGATFTGTLAFDASDRGTATNPIQISSYGTGRATIDAGVGTGITIYNAGGYQISNLNFVGSGPVSNTGNGIDFYNNLLGNVKLNGIAIDNVEVSGFRNYGIALGGWNNQSGYENVRVTNVLVHNNGKVGFTTYAQLPNVNENVYVAHVYAYGNLGIPDDPTPTGSGIVLGGVDTGIIERSIAYGNGAFNNAKDGPVGIWAYDSTNITIQYNESYNNRTGGSADGDGFDLDQNVSNSVMQYNYSHDNDGAGFLLAQGPKNLNHTGNIVRYNISQNDGRKLNYAGIQVFGNVRNAEIYNNTVFMQAGSANSPAAVLIYNPVSHVHFRNNIFQTQAGVKLIDAPDGSEDLLFQGNNYYATDSPFVVQWGKTTYSSLDRWRTATDQETLFSQNVGMSVDPLLTNPGGGKVIGDSDRLNTLSAYQLHRTSPLIDAGLDLKTLFSLNPGSQDFYGTPLPQNSGYDIGSDEF